MNADFQLLWNLDLSSSVLHCCWSRVAAAPSLLLCHQPAAAFSCAPRCPLTGVCRLSPAVRAGTTALGLLGGGEKGRSSGSTQNLPNQNLHFDKSCGRFLPRSVFAQPCPRGSPSSFPHAIRNVDRWQSPGLLCANRCRTQSSEWEGQIKSDFKVAEIWAPGCLRR